MSRRYRRKSRNGKESFRCDYYKEPMEFPPGMPESDEFGDDQAYVGIAIALIAVVAALLGILFIKGAF